MGRIGRDYRIVDGLVVCRIGYSDLVVCTATEDEAFNAELIETLNKLPEDEGEDAKDKQQDQG